MQKIITALYNSIFWRKNDFSLNASTRENGFRPLSQPFIRRNASKHQSTYNGCVPSPNHIPAMRATTNQIPAMRATTKQENPAKKTIELCLLAMSLRAFMYRLDKNRLLICFYVCNPLAQILLTLRCPTYMGCIYYWFIKSLFIVLPF